MRVLPAILIAGSLVPAPGVAQTATVPLQGNTPSRDTTVDRPPRATGDARTPAEVPNARNRPNGQVAPPAAIDTPVQVIAPEKK